MQILMNAQQVVHADIPWLSLLTTVFWNRQDLFI